MKVNFVAIYIIVFTLYTSIHCSLYYETNVKTNRVRDPDELKTIDQIIISHGYPLETHYITTEDEYILKVFRITGPKNKKFINSKDNYQPILLQHALMDSSDSWVSNSEELSYAFTLANKGFDVWLGNNRGNKHSRNHVSLNPNSKQFWDYSFHEMGLKDIPAEVDYILNTNTNYSKVIYIGHSQGCTQFMALCSLLPNYCSNKIKGMIALGPAVFLGNYKSNEVKLAFELGLVRTYELLGIHEVFPMRDSKVSKLICRLYIFLCNKGLQYLSDSHPKEDNNQDRMDVYYSHLPSGSSLKSIKHFKKLIDTRRFIRYDNNEDYPLDKINVPLYIHIGQHDLMVVPQDGQVFRDYLNKEYVKFYNEYDHLGHLGFVLTNGKDNLLQNVLKNIEDIMLNEPN